MGDTGIILPANLRAKSVAANIGLEGTVVGKNPKKGALYIDFGKKIIGDGFTTYNLAGLIPSDTGLGFYDRGWISSKIDPRFDIRNLDKLT